MTDYSGLTGNVILPSNPSYDYLRRDFNLYYSYFPKAIVYVDDTADVINAVNWARCNNINIRSRCGGHSYESFSVANNSLVVDVRNLVKFELDRKNNLVTIGSGYKLGDLYRDLAASGYQFTGGSCFNVGVSGYVTGGGLGFSQRLYGLSSDNLVQLKLINAYGEEVIANDKVNSDLFWACRGAGQNNFGVFTEFTFKVYPVDKVTLINIVWEKNKRMDLLEVYQKVTRNLNNAITLKYDATADECYIKGISYAPLEYTKHEIRDILNIEDKTRNVIEYVPFIEASVYFGDGGTANAFKDIGIYVFKPFTKKAMETIFNYLDSCPSRYGDVVFGLLEMGGKIKENKEVNSCFAYRNALFIIQVETALTDICTDSEEILWVESFINALKPYACGRYINYQDIFINNYLEAYYGKNVARLECIKNKYNPTSLFDYPQGL